MTAKTPTKRTRKPTPALTEAEALGILASAINHCREAGLRVSMGNVSAWFTLSIRDVELVGDKLVAVQEFPEVPEAV